MGKIDKRFVETESAAIRAEIEDIRDGVRASLVAHAGVAVDPDTLRVTAREMEGEVRNRLLDTVPQGEKLAEMIAREPEWLYVDLRAGGILHDVVRNEVRDAVLRRVAPAILAVVRAEFEGVDLETVISACREASETASGLGTDEASVAAAALVRACDEVESQDAPHSFGLVGPMEDAFVELRDASKGGDLNAHIPARRLMELLEHVNMNHADLDSSARRAPAPRP